MLCNASTLILPSKVYEAWVLHIKWRLIRMNAPTSYLRSTFCWRSNLSWEISIKETPEWHWTYCVSRWMFMEKRPKIHQAPKKSKKNFVCLNAPPDCCTRMHRLLISTLKNWWHPSARVLKHWTSIRESIYWWQQTCYRDIKLKEYHTMQENEWERIPNLSSHWFSKKHEVSNVTSSAVLLR